MTHLLKRNGLVKKMVTLGSLFCLVFVTVFCCCLSAHAAMEKSAALTTESVPSCHSSSSENNASVPRPDYADCQCDGLTADTDSSLKYVSASQVTWNLFQPVIQYVAKSSLQMANDSLLLVEHINISATPLYLKNAVLRL